MSEDAGIEPTVAAFSNISARPHPCEKVGEEVNLKGKDWFRASADFLQSIWRISISSKKERFHGNEGGGGGGRGDIPTK